MSLFDLILLIILLLFAGAGYRFGLIHAVGSLVGIVVGLVVAGKTYVAVAAYLLTVIGGNESVLRIVSYIVIFILVNRLVGVLFWLLERFYNLAAVVPGLKMINRSLGALLGLIEGILILGILFHLVGRFPIISSLLAPIAKSQLAQWILSVSAVLIPLLPPAFRKLVEVDWETVRRLAAFPGGIEALKKVGDLSGATPIVEQLKRAGPQAVELFKQLQQSIGR
jgi:membrane protein required for colicin V production